MYKIYFNNNFILFLPTDANLPSDVESCKFDITKVLKKVENNKNVAVFCNDCYKTFKEFSSFFEVRQAAGGLVKGDKGDFLMIFRNNCWDLPKGHLEKGESLEQCALREVSEECGVGGLILDKFLCETMHIYPLKNKLILKITSWFSMQTTQNQVLIPQIQEGITQVKWLSVKQIQDIKSSTYQSITHVLQNIG